MKKIISVLILLAAFLPFDSIAQDANLNLDKQFLESLPDEVRTDVLKEVNKESDEDKNYRSIPSVALEKSETLRKWNDFLEDNKIPRNESDIFGIEFFKSFFQK